MIYYLVYYLGPQHVTPTKPPLPLLASQCVGSVALDIGYYSLYPAMDRGKYPGSELLC